MQGKVVSCKPAALQKKKENQKALCLDSEQVIYLHSYKFLRILQVIVFNQFNCDTSMIRGRKISSNTFKKSNINSLN